MVSVVFFHPVILATDGLSASLLSALSSSLKLDAWCSAFPSLLIRSAVLEAHMTVQILVAIISLVMVTLISTGVASHRDSIRSK